MEETNISVFSNWLLTKKSHVYKKFEEFSKVYLSQKNNLRDQSNKFISTGRAKTKIAVLASILLFNLLPFNLSGPTPIINTAKAVSQGDLDRLNAEIGNLNSLLQQKRGEKASLQNEIAIFDAQIKQLELQIQATNLEVNKTNEEIVRANEEIVRLLEELKAHKNVLKENIKVLYEEGRVSAVEVFASSENFSDYLNKNEYLLTIQSKVRDTMDRINALRKEVEGKKVQLEDKKRQLDELKKKQTAQSVDLNTQRAQKDALLAKTAGEEANYASVVEEKRAAYASAQAQLEAALNAPRFVSQGSVKRGDIIGYEGNTGYSFGAHLHWGVYIGSQDVDPTSYVNSGQLANPLPGAPITQGYWGAFSHRGVGWPGGWDLAAPSGTPIRAAANGNIIQNVNSGPFGHHIIMDHGGGLRTLYAHMQ